MYKSPLTFKSQFFLQILPFFSCRLAMTEILNLSSQDTNTLNENTMKLEYCKTKHLYCIFRTFLLLTKRLFLLFYKSLLLNNKGKLSNLICIWKGSKRSEKLVETIVIDFENLFYTWIGWMIG